jgi:hypothetical protein
VIEGDGTSHPSDNGHDHAKNLGGRLENVIGAKGAPNARNAPATSKQLPENAPANAAEFAPDQLGAAGFDESSHTGEASSGASSAGLAPAGGSAALTALKALGGDLPCVRCRYNLKGLSVRAVCPECGVPVRVTLLAVVDPHAGELQPISWRTPIALGLILWSLGAVAAVFIVWILRISELGLRLGSTGSRFGAFSTAFFQSIDNALSPPIGGGLITLFTLISAIGAIALVTPHGLISLRHKAAAAIAVFTYFPLAATLWWIHCVLDARVPSPYFGPSSPMDDPARELARIACAGFIVVIVLGVRANWQTMIKRSVLMRTGRRERQPMPTLAIAAGIAAAGDLVRLVARNLLGDPDSIIFTLGTSLVAIGSILLTVGFVGVLLDAWRLRGVILEPTLSLNQMLEKHDPA